MQKWLKTVRLDSWNLGIIWNYFGINILKKKIMDNTVIKVLDREHGKKVIKFFKQYCDTGELDGTDIGIYYGIINGEFDRWTTEEVIKHNAEIMELPQAKTYPRVMLVSDDNKNWDNQRVVFMEKCGGYLAWCAAETLEDAEKEIGTYFWKYAKDIEYIEYIEVMLEEIAKWKGVSKEQIKIKQ